MSNAECIAVLDVGKTNLKVLVATPDGEAVDAVAAPNRHALAGAYAAIDIEAIEAWMLDTLTELQRRHPIRALITTAHGCGALLCDEAGPVLPMMDYEARLPAALEASYAAERPPFEEVCFGAGLAAMSLAKQLLHQSESHPHDFGRATRLLTTAQYLAWRFGGRAASEISQLAAQSHLWDYRGMQPSSFLRRRGWDRLLPPLARAGEVLGTLSPELARRTGLPASTELLCGVHDSNANLYRYKAAGLGGHAVLSTGTWMIGFRRGRLPAAADAALGMVGNIDVDGEPIASTLTMTGREYAVLDDASGAADEAALAVLPALLGRGTLATPSFVEDDGIAPGSAGRGRVHGPPPITPTERHALASLYAALSADACLDALGAATEAVVVDGGFARNRCFLHLLAGLRTGQPVVASASAEGTALGAALLWRREARREPPAPLELDAVEPWAGPGLRTAAARWRTLWPGASTPRAAA